MIRHAFAKGTLVHYAILCLRFRDVCVTCRTACADDCLLHDWVGSRTRLSYGQKYGTDTSGRWSSAPRSLATANVTLPSYRTCKSPETPMSLLHQVRVLQIPLRMSDQTLVLSVQKRNAH
jgi:hypothetical protein